MFFDRCFSIAALVCLAVVLCSGASLQAQAPAALPRDEEAKMKADELVSEGKYLEAAAAYQDGIAAAARQANHHARSELEDALEKVRGKGP